MQLPPSPPTSLRCPKVWNCLLLSWMMKLEVEKTSWKLLEPWPVLSQTCWRLWNLLQERWVQKNFSGSLFFGHIACALMQKFLEEIWAGSEAHFLWINAFHCYLFPASPDSFDCSWKHWTSKWGATETNWREWDRWKVPGNEGVACHCQNCAVL